MRKPWTYNYICDACGKARQAIDVPMGWLVLDDLHVCDYCTGDDQPVGKFLRAMRKLP